ncbi:MAG: dihydroorotate dehydrogenase electron transfer subunit [Treponema sp.]|jgi:NAD(P)H-flavin reductase|nr:dihydroorotate dehydrogenase electron transfer subunit [Treponema sp.]
MCQETKNNSLLSELVSNHSINNDTFCMSFKWEGRPPKAGQFFMIKPVRSNVFLPRPISIFEYIPSQNIVKFLIVKVGKGTAELSAIKPGEKVRLSGPFGNSWEDFLPEDVRNSGGKAGLVGGSAGVAPLAALVAEKPELNFYFLAGFKNGFSNNEEETATLGAAVKAKKLILTAEDGRNALHGKVTDYLFDLESYSVILACGSSGMLKSVIKKCETKEIPCFVSMESRMACGVGACYGCTIHTANGTRRLCADGPIFRASDVLFGGAI